MTEKAKAQIVSLQQLASSIEKAAKLAAERQGVALGDDTIVHRWEIIGRVLSDISDLNTAYKVAEEIAAGVNVPGVKAEPVVSSIGQDILVGFVDRANALKSIK